MRLRFLGLRHYVALVLARRLTRWMCKPAVVLVLLEWINPRAMVECDDAPVEQAQIVSLLLQQLLGFADERFASPGDLQAIDEYGTGVAIGFYGITPDQTLLATIMTPVPGSHWSEAQLRRARRLGYRNGECVRT